MVFWFEPSHPPGNSSLASYFPLKFLAFKTPLPLRISNDHPWGGCGSIFSGMAHSENKLLGIFFVPYWLHKIFNFSNDISKKIEAKKLSKKLTLLKSTCTWLCSSVYNMRASKPRNSCESCEPEVPNPNKKANGKLTKQCVG